MLPIRAQSEHNFLYSLFLRKADYKKDFHSGIGERNRQYTAVAGLNAGEITKEVYQCLVT